MSVGVFPRAWLMVTGLFLPTLAQAQDALLLTEAFPPGYRYHVSSRVQLSGQLTIPAMNGEKAQSVAMTGESAIEYDERMLEPLRDAQGPRTLRVYSKIDLQRKLADKPQGATLRPSVRRLVILRHQQAEVPFSPDGPLMWDEIDLIRTDVFTPALVGLLSEKAVRPGDRWVARAEAVAELTDMDRIEDGQIDCVFEQLTTLANRRYARIRLSGTIRGVNEDGPSRQQLDGSLYFDLQSRHLSYLSLRGIHELLDEKGQSMGRVEGQFVISRQANITSDELSDDRLRTLTLEPNDDNTRLLYDNPDLGLRLLYSRRWRVGIVQGRQLAIDESRGPSGLLITLETTSTVPTPTQFQIEALTYLQKQKVRVIRTEPVRRLQSAPQELDHFAIETESATKRPVRMDYFTLRQTIAGATLAARIDGRDRDILQREVEQIARSVTLTRKIELRDR